MTEEIREGLEPEFEIELSELPLDMTAVYNFLTTQYAEKPDQCPMAAVVKDLPGGRKTIPLKTGDGKIRVILVKEGTNLDIVSALYEEFQNPSEADELPIDSDFYYDSADVYELYGTILFITNALGIPCPQLVYMKNYPVAGSNVLGARNEMNRTILLFLRQLENITLEAKHMAYELRHSWQHEKHEKLYFSDYFMPSEGAGEDERHRFMLQKAEIDAEAFSMRLIGHMVGGTAKPNKSFADVNQAIEERANKMALPF